MKTRIEEASEKFTKSLQFETRHEVIDGTTLLVDDRFHEAAREFMGMAFIAGAEFMQEETVNIMDAMTQTSQCNYKLKAQNEIMREALKRIPEQEINNHERKDMIAREALEKIKGEK
jgi:hypothetical protein